MRRNNIILIILLLLSIIKTKAQRCPIELGYNYTIYVFSSQNNISLNDLMGSKIDPIIFHVVQIKNDETKKKIDKLCLTGKMETSIFIYPGKDNSKIIRFCNQQEYTAALKSNLELKLE